MPNKFMINVPNRLILDTNDVIMNIVFDVKVMHLIASNSI